MSLKKIPQIFTVIFFLLLAVSSFSQDYSKIDSLKSVLKNVSGKEKVEVLNELSKAYFGVSPEKILEFANQALELSEEMDYNKGKAQALNRIGTGYYYQSNYDKAIEYYLKSLEIYKNIGGKYEIAVSINNIGNNYYYLSDYNRALEYYLTSLKKFEEINDKKGVASSSNNIGNIYCKINNYDKAVEYYLKSLRIAEEIGDKKRIANSSNNIGDLYQYLNNYDKAKKYHLKSLEIYEDIGDKYGIASSLINIGNTYLNFTNYEKALEYYLKSLKIYREIGNKIGIVSSLINIGDVYIKLQNYNKASAYIEQSLKLAEDIEAKELITHTYIAFSELYSAKNNYEKSLEYYKLYSELNDSIFTEDMSKKIAEMQTKYETEKKEQEIAKLNIEKQLKEEKLKSHQNWLTFFIIISLIIFTFLIIVYIQKIQKIRTNKVLVQKNLEIVGSEKELFEISEKLKTIINKYEKNAVEKNDKTAIKYAGSSLTNEQKQDIKKLIINYMNSSKTFLDCGFSINTLAKDLDVSRSYISHVINELFNQNFSNLLNEYRIKEARQILSDPDNSKYTIETIANMVGCKSKVTFIHAFKKYVGVTPSFYINSLKNEDTYLYKQ